MVSAITLKFIFFGLVILAISGEVIGDILFKKWSLNGKNAILTTGFIIYSIGTLFWAFSLKYEVLSKAISVLTILNLIIIVLIGVLYFNENLSFMNKIGISLGILSMILIEI